VGPSTPFPKVPGISRGWKDNLSPQWSSDGNELFYITELSPNFYRLIAYEPKTKKAQIVVDGYGLRIHHAYDGSYMIVEYLVNNISRSDLVSLVGQPISRRIIYDKKIIGYTSSIVGVENSKYALFWLTAPNAANYSLALLNTEDASVRFVDTAPLDSENSNWFSQADDPKWITYTTLSNDKARIKVLDLSSGANSILLTTDRGKIVGYGINWSPDNTQLAVTAYDVEISDQIGLSVVSLDKGWQQLAKISRENAWNQVLWSTCNP